VTLKEQLTRDEGLRLHPYKDSVGKLTIGVGRNLDDVGISQQEAEFLLDNDIQEATSRLLEALPWAAGLDLARFSVLINMTFNMGIGGLMGFKHFLAAVQAGDYKLARDHMLASLWAEQVGPRAHRLAIQIETGVFQ
jgi:lysozyme